MSDATGVPLSFERVTLCVGTRTLLREVELQLPARGMVGLVGANGIGKTSLLRAALGLITPAAGRVLLHGRSPQQWDAQALAQRVGYVAQHAHSHWDLTVREILNLHPHAQPADWIDRCELEPLLTRRLARLSGGERARVALACALAHRPSIVLADEPGAHLDIPHYHRVMALLGEAARQCAVLIVLHDLHLASRYCDRLALLGQGRLLAAGAPVEVLTTKLLAQAYDAPVCVLRAQGQSFFTSLDRSGARRTSAQ